MTEFNISQAAIVTSTSRATIQRKIKSGEISVRSEGQEKLIDIAELIRVFGELKEPLIQHNVQVETSSTEQVLRERIEDLQEQVRYLKKQIEQHEQTDKALLEMLSTEQKKTERLLPNPQKSTGFLARIFKKQLETS